MKQKKWTKRINGFQLEIVPKGKTVVYVDIIQTAPKPRHKLVWSMTSTRKVSLRYSNIES